MWQKPLPAPPLSKPVFCRSLAIGFREKEKKKRGNLGQNIPFSEKGNMSPLKKNH
jgi:hypothetical protein